MRGSERGPQDRVRERDRARADAVFAHLGVEREEFRGREIAQAHGADPCDDVRFRHGAVRRDGRRAPPRALRAVEPAAHEIPDADRRVRRGARAEVDEHLVRDFSARAPVEIEPAPLSRLRIGLALKRTAPFSRAEFDNRTLTLRPPFFCGHALGARGLDVRVNYAAQPPNF